MPLGVDETSKQCKDFVLVPKANGKVWLCLDPTRLSKVLIKLVHRGSALNYILPRLAGVKYIIFINASSGYHNLKLNKRSSYLSAFSCLFGRYKYIQLSFGVATVGNIFQEKIYELFSDMPNIFIIADDILIAGFDELGKGLHATLDKELRQADFKLKKGKCLFRCTSIPFFSEIISHQGGSLDPRKVHVLTDMLPLKSKRELQSFLGILHYLCSPVTAEMCKPFQKVTLVKDDWTWNRM